MSDLDPAILRYYAQEWDEDARLRSGLNELEFVRTQELLRRHLPETGLRILDVGGASGVHAEWLLDDGHHVDLVDPVPLHVDQALDALGDHPRFTARIGDARALDESRGEYDVVLLLGPLYHLTERDERLQAMSSANACTRPGGLVVAAAISRFASLIAGLTQDEYHVPEFRSIIERDLVDGQHRNPVGRDYFTTAYFHHPDELRNELADAGLRDVELYAVESIVGAMPHLASDWRDPDRRSAILHLVRRVEQEPTLLGVGPHLLAFGRVADAP